MTVVVVWLECIVPVSPLDLSKDQRAATSGAFQRMCSRGAGSWPVGVGGWPGRHSGSSRVHVRSGKLLASLSLTGLAVGKVEQNYSAGVTLGQAFCSKCTAQRAELCLLCWHCRTSDV